MSLKESAITGLKWSSFSYVGRRAMAFITNIALARMLSPDDFGLVAMASVVLGFIELFKDLGTGSAVIQRKELSQNLLSSIFWINTGFGLLATLVLYTAAPLLALFYHQPAVAELLRILSLTFFISALGIVQNSLLHRNMAFSQLARIELATSILSCATAVGAALAGFGVMSLVYQPLIGSIATLGLLWRSSSWRPSWNFAWSEIRGVAGYSLNLTGFNMLNYLTRNADNLLIGRYLGAENLGYYDLAYRLMLYPLQGISAVVGKVMFPVYSQIQDDLAKFRAIYLSAIGAIALVSFPVMLGLFAVSDYFILALFGPQWQPVTELLMIFAPVGALQSITTTVGSIYQAKNRTGWLLYWGIGSSLFMMIAFIIGLYWGMIGVAMAYAIATLIITFPGFIIPFSFIKLPLRDLFKVLWRSLVSSLLMCALIRAIATWIHYPIQPIIILGSLVLIGALVYLFFTWLINRQQFLNTLASLRGK